MKLKKKDKKDKRLRLLIFVRDNLNLKNKTLNLKSFSTPYQKKNQGSE